MTGTVTDVSGARVADAKVELNAATAEKSRSTSSDPSGKFTVIAPAGKYNLVVTAPGFDPFVLPISVGSAPIRVDAKLAISTAQSVVEVNGDSGGNTSEDANGSALTLDSRQLANLSDDDATFQQQLQALAGGGDGQHPPQMYVDGFPGGQMPPKSAIRAVRINQNPFSAEYDQLGFGRIEILTKPGTGKLHGQLEIFGDPSAFNSQNPFVHVAEPGYYRVHTLANLSGPLSKKTSFFVSADYYDQQNNAIINAQTVNGSGALAGVSAAIPDPQQTSSYSARIDTQWSKNNTFTGRYEFDRVAQTNAGLSEFVLPSEGYASAVNTSTLQLGNTQVLNAHAELDSKLQWIRTRTAQNPVSAAPTILVQGTVSDGGSPAQTLHDNLDQLMFQESGTYEHGKNFVRAGVRYRLNRDANLSTGAYNGTFIFNNLAAYQASVLGTPSASQFQITTGQSSFSVLTGDLALWAEDEWKVRKNVTADVGFRFESQSAIPDHADPSPHVGVSWAIHQTDKKPARVVLRAGAAMFYDRFPVGNLITAVRQGNTNLEQTYTIKNPTFFATTAAQLGSVLSQPGFSLGSSSAPTTYRVAPNFRAEYDINAGATAEISLGKYGSVSVNYLLDRGVHQWYSRNANAPFVNGTRPHGAAAGNQYEFASGGESYGNVVFANPQINLTKKIQAWGFFILQHNKSDTQGANSFSSNDYNVHQDYGRAVWDRRAGAYTGVDADLFWGLHVGTFLAARGGRPFDITTGLDDNGNTLYNDRPSFASAASNPANVVRTSYGNFDTVPQAGEAIIPHNYGQSPRFVSLQVQLQKTVKFGPRIAVPSEGPPPPPLPKGQKAPLPDPRYALVFSAEAENITNTRDPAQPIGVLNSPFFGQSIASANSFLSTTAANRTFMVHTAFRF